MTDANLMACLISKSHAKKMLFCQDSETAAQMCSVKKVFLEISQKSQGNTCVRVSFLIKLQASGQQVF